MPGDQCAHQVATSVSRAVVDNEHFKNIAGACGILEEARQATGAQVRLLVVTGDDDGDARCVVAAHRAIIARLGTVDHKRTTRGSHSRGIAQKSPSLATHARHHMYVGWRGWSPNSSSL